MHSTSLSLQYLKGVGPQRYELLKRLGLNTVGDLLYYIPRTWLDRTNLQKIKTISFGESTVLYARVERTSVTMTRSGITIFKAVLSDATGTIDALWFRRHSYRYDVFATMKKNLVKGRFVFVTGIADWEGIRVDEYECDDELDKLIHMGKIVPVYRATEGIPHTFIRSLVKRILDEGVTDIHEFLPSDVITHYALADCAWSLRHIHFPESWEAKDRAYRRLAFDEFLLLELALMRERGAVAKEHKPHQYQLHRTLLTPFKEHLGFTFTNDQKKAIIEIFNDMQKSSPMNRLLQGDVGSGKTVVALSAMLLAAENKFQSLMMAPTEVLAEQHFISMTNVTQGLNVRIALYSGSMPQREKKLVQAAVEKGEIDILVGTHALLDAALNIPHLTLVVIDEQHRFGVHQRLKLRTKAACPDVLVMTATPIPRTLALTAYGDLDVSNIHELPKGRKKIATHIAGSPEAFSVLREQIAQGRQGYVVYPVVEEGNKRELKAAVAMYQHLRETELRSARVGLLHGRMKLADKQQVMRQFSTRERDVLVATTVIEVGIDVPNATVMIIEHAERFGLATLHQLRGRVGRGQYASYCFLLTEANAALSHRRLSALVAYNDGFKLAEEDLLIRGPGDLLGEAQHGLPELRVGNLVTDGNIITDARNAAHTVLEQDSMLTQHEHTRLAAMLASRYGVRCDLVKVG